MQAPDGEDGEVVAGELGRDADLVVLGLHARLGGEGRHHAVTADRNHSQISVPLSLF